MDLRHFDTSDVTPILVKLYDKQKDYTTIQHNKPKMRVELTEVVSDLLDVQLNAREREIVSDVLVGLLRQAEVDLRQALAERLAVLDNVPLRLALEMANDEIAVAGPILRKSSVLGDLDLVYLIKSKEAQYWREIAKRQHLNAHVVNVLSDTKDLATALTLVENQNITLTSYAVRSLADLAQGYQQLSQPLLGRKEVTPDIAKALMDHVGEATKAYIKDHYDLDSQDVDGIVDDIVFEMSPIAESSDEYWPDQTMIKNAAILRKKHALSPSLLIKTLKREQYRMFIALFADLSGSAVECVIHAMKEPKAYTYAALCRVCGMNKSDFVSIYFLTNFMRSDCNAVVQTSHFNKASEYFDMLEPGLAKKILSES